MRGFKTVRDARGCGDSGKNSRHSLFWDLRYNMSVLTL